MGDLVVTCISPFSRNRRVGEELGAGRPLPEILAGMTMVAEGVRTAAAPEGVRTAAPPIGPRYAAPPRAPDTAPQPKASGAADNVKRAPMQMTVRLFITVCSRCFSVGTTASSPFVARPAAQRWGMTDMNRRIERRGIGDVSP
jgi:hypothetical protein